MKYIILTILLIVVPADSMANMLDCLDDIQRIRNSLPLESKDDGSDIYHAVHIDKKYAECFVRKLAISRNAPIKVQAQQVLDYTSTIIRYEADKDVASIHDLNRPGTRLPSRTIVDGKGDCEDKAALAALMLKELGIATFIVKRPPINNGLDHIFLGIGVDYDTGLKCGSASFEPFDPTLSNAKVGEFGAGFKQVKTFLCGRI